MKSVSDIDVNFKVESKLNRDGIKFFNSVQAPFVNIYGVFRENGLFKRMPEKIARSISDGVYALHSHTAGGRVRFRTNSKYVAIAADMGNVGKMPHFAFSGSMGFDLYAGNEYVKTYIPPIDAEKHYDGIIEFENKAMRDITINFPLYSEVRELYIGLENNCVAEKATPYRNIPPMVYYGSSITQGGCASRPGNCYQNIIARKFNCDYINLGFSGNAKAEGEMINYIKSLNMSLFIYDYDHNAPSIEHLESTHEKMFKEIRKSNTKLPIIMMTRPKFYLTEEEKKRREIIKATYENAAMSGDKNVYFIDGVHLTELCENEGTVDGVHPNDFGFASMAKALERVIDHIDIK